MMHTILVSYKKQMIMIQIKIQLKKVKEVIIQSMIQMKFMIQEPILLGTIGGRLSLNIQITIAIKMKFFSFFKNLKKIEKQITC